MKKVFLITAILISSYCNSQCTEMNVENDDVAEKTRIRSDKMIINDLTITVECSSYNKNFNVLDFLVKDKCVDKDDEIIIVFKNGEKVKYYNTFYDFNCSGQSAMLIQKSKRELFITEKISIIRVNTRNSSTQVQLSELESDKLLKIIQCALNRKEWESQIKYK